jgi:hypothetical protein
MLLISEVWASQSDRRNFKAPKGVQYKIDTIAFNVMTGAGNQMHIVDYLIEDDSPADIGLSLQSLITFDLNNVPFGLSITDVDHKTKYLSLSPRINTTAFSASISIFGSLVPLSKVDAVMEWFRKGR